MSLKKEKEKRKARLVSSRRMADASSGKVSKAYRLPAGRSMFAVEGDKNYTFDVVCYAAGKGNPGADEGFDAAGRPYSAHSGVGPNNDRYCCPFNTFDGKPCPICQSRSNRIREGHDPKTDDLIRKWRASDRTLANVWDHADRGKKCQLFDISNFAFWQMLYKTVDENPDKYEYWASPGVEGFTVKASFEKKKIGTGDFPSCWKIELLPRSEPIPDDILESAMCLDDMLICPDFDKLKMAFEQGTAEPDDPAEIKQAAARATQPAAPSRAAPEEEDGGPEEYEAGDWVLREGKKWEVISVRDGMLNLEDLNGKIIRGIDPEECEPTEKPTGNGKPAAKAEIIPLGSRKKKPPKDEEEE